MPTIYLVRHGHAVWTPSEARPWSFPDVYAARVDGDTLIDLERIWDVP